MPILKTIKNNKLSSYQVIRTSVGSVSADTADTADTAGSKALWQYGQWV
ncbi:hypothetical protein [Microbulbifer spongiae]|uniref:Uncharacterized protein n=1 Tax=Microbulbifer spongiae TaxID=2944933 RepID=A0ABY9EFH0_9GAMM|nr:hypothetical protein [Microbulbifer sp. MI-G]WKD50793.1 hypothetical protein M8T91_05040 [Microbulbifer sp. MI-G]